MRAEQNRTGGALIVHPGTQYAPRLGAALAHYHRLYRYWTGFGIPDSGWMARILNVTPAYLRERIGRQLPGLTAHQVRLRPHLELMALWRQRQPRADIEDVFFQRNRTMQEAVPDSELEAAHAVIGFDTSSWILGQRCSKIGRPLIVDQSIAHPYTKERVYLALREQFPDWRTEFVRKKESLVSLEVLEHELANRIAVASSFSRNSLIENGVPAGKIEVIPYGVDAESFIPRSTSRGDRPLRFVFVGAVTARKGVPLLLEVWSRLAREGIELWLIGHVTESVRAILPNLPGLRVFGAKPHQEVAVLMRQCDVFVFPSFFEGFGLVILEAMASGLPVITTDATAGPDVLDACTGMVVPSGNAFAFEEAMDKFIVEPHLAVEMGRAARAKALEASWERYGERWIALLDRV